MPVAQVHPLLREKEPEPANPDEASVEQSPEPVVEEPVVVVPEAGEEASTPQDIVPAPQPEPEPDWILKLDSRSLYQDLRRLETERADVRQTLAEFTGRTAKKKYEPQIRALEAKLAAKEQEFIQLQAQTMTDEDLAEKLRTDRDFALRYHAQPEDPSALEEVSKWESEFEDTLDMVATRLNKAREVDYRVALVNGYFGDLDANPARALRNMMTAISTETESLRPAAPAPVAEAPAPAATPAVEKAPAVAAVAPKANPAITEAQPDLSAPSHGKGGGVVRLSEYRLMSPLEKIERFGSDLQAAINRGELVVDV